MINFQRDDSNVLWMYEQIDRLLIACLTVTALKLGPILAFALDPDPTSESENGFGGLGVYVDLKRYVIDTLCLAAAVLPCYINIITRGVNLYGLFKLLLAILFELGTTQS